MAAVDIVEIRVLDGANIYSPRPAVKVHLRVAPPPSPDALERARERLRRGLPGGRADAAEAPREVDGVGRDLLAPAIVALHAAVGLPEPPISLRAPGPPGETIVAFDWEWRSAGEGIARGAVALVEAALTGAAYDAGALIAELKEALARDRETGDRPLFVRDADRRIPIVGLTGTNGKTTTTRCLTHILMTAGSLVGMASSGGVWIGEEQVLEGDYTGPTGARRVLEDRRVEVAVLETARGGILLRGIAYESNDVGVVTNVSADHLGMHGIDTVEGLAEVKSLVVRLTRPEGQAVLNADDPLTRAMAGQVRAPVTFFSRQPDSEPVRAHLAAGGRALLASEGRIVAAMGAAREPVLALKEVPMTFGGRAPHMVENALAATAAALALGLDAPTVARGLASFANSPDKNYGRLNVFRLRRPACTAIVDYAHNEAGISQLLDFGAHYREGDGRLIAIIGTAGDRPRAILEGIGRVAGQKADLVWVKETDRYLRGATKEAMNAAFVAGIEAGRGRAGGYQIAPGETAALDSALAAARDGDVIAIMCLEQQAEVLDTLEQRGELALG